VPAEFFAVQWNQTYKLLGVFWTLGIELHYPASTVVGKRFGDN